MMHSSLLAGASAPSCRNTCAALCCCLQLLQQLYHTGRSTIANANDPQGMLFSQIKNAAHLMTQGVPKELQVGPVSGKALFVHYYL
jgi:hypothetical protein